MYRGKDGFEKDFVESAKSQDCKVLRHTIQQMDMQG